MKRTIKDDLEVEVDPCLVSILQVQCSPTLGRIQIDIEDYTVLEVSVDIASVDAIDVGVDSDLKSVGVNIPRQLRDMSLLHKTVEFNVTCLDWTKGPIYLLVTLVLIVLCRIFPFDLLKRPYIVAVIRGCEVHIDTYNLCKQCRSFVDVGHDVPCSPNMMYLRKTGYGRGIII